MIDKLNLILKNMDNIEYGFVDYNKKIYFDTDKDFDKEFSSKYRLQSPKCLLSTKFGVCWDQVELERYYFEKFNIMCNSYFMYLDDGNDYPTHTFIVGFDNNYYYWIEHSWEKYRGVHRYECLDDLFNDISIKFGSFNNKNNNSNSNISIFRYNKPKYNISCSEFYNHCTSSVLVKKYS